MSGVQTWAVPKKEEEEEEEEEEEQEEEHEQKQEQEQPALEQAGEQRSRSQTGQCSAPTPHAVAVF